MERKFSIGDRVRRTNGRAKGKVGRVIGYDNDLYCVEFDEDIRGHSCCGLGKEGHCWNCFEKNLELENPCKVIFKGKETILIKDGKEYVSKCADGDKYDKEKGVLLCLAKASGVNYADLQKMIDGAEDKNKEYAKKHAEALKAFIEAGRKTWEVIGKEVKALNLDNANVKPEAEKTVKEVKRHAKVGEYIKIVAPTITFGDYDKGDVLKVKNVDKFCVEVEYYGEDAHGCGKCTVIDHCEYVVLENYKSYKITLSEFWKSEKELAIHCKTEKEAKELLKAFDKAGKKWASGRKYTEATNWEIYGENTVYYNGESCGAVGYAIRRNIKIYDFDKVDLNN